MRGLDRCSIYFLTDKTRGMLRERDLTQPSFFYIQVIIYPHPKANFRNQKDETAAPLQIWRGVLQF